MSDKIRVVVKSDEDEAKVAQEKFKLKGYEVSIYNATNVVLDGTDLGGHLDFFSDIGGKVFIIVGIK